MKSLFLITSLTTGLLLSSPVVGDSKAITQPELGTIESCQAHNGIPAGWPHQPKAGMLLIPGGQFEPGTWHAYIEEWPSGEVIVEPFWMDRTEVTNAQFAQFIEATGYVTEAELLGGAAVFRMLDGQAPADMNWWHFVPGANWRQPEGPQSSLEGRLNEPVTLVSYQDAKAYAEWLGHDLPTEAEWEWAARANNAPEEIDREPRGPDGEFLANYWQGIFPILNAGADGFSGRSPVGCFPANGFGLYDMIGNVWEWTLDAYTGQRQRHGSGDPIIAFDAQKIALQNTDVMTIKGGSFLCSSDYCARFRSTARHPQEASLGATHVGFRTVLRESKQP